MNQTTGVPLGGSYTSCESIKETAFQNNNLTVDIRVGAIGVTVIKEGFWEKVKVRLVVKKLLP